MKNKQVLFIVIPLGVLFVSTLVVIRNKYENNCNKYLDSEYKKQKLDAEYYKRQYEYYKNITKEIYMDTRFHISPGDFYDEIEHNCLLVVTNGTEPVQSDSSSLLHEHIFPIGTLDIFTDHIQYFEGDEEWKYWLVCSDKYIELEMLS